MKRIGNVYDTILDKERIKAIIILAAKGKKKRREVQRVLADIDYYADRILEMLETGNITLGKTHNRTITEKGKKRLLTISPFFPNRILDYVMVETLKPYIKKSMYSYCIGNVDSRGMVYGKKVIAKKYKKYKYYIKLDIHKFYPSVSSENLMRFVRTKVKDKRFLHLCEAMILSEPCLPIGSYYSQWFSNWYLQDLDHYIKEELGIPFYIRYVDDMVLMGNNKRQLLNAMYNIQRKLKEKGLCLKRFEQVYTVAVRPLDFLGFRFLEGKIYLRTRNFKVLNRRIRKVRKTGHICLSQAQSIMSYLGWLSQIKVGYAYYRRYIYGIARKGKLRKIISASDRKLLLLLPKATLPLAV